ncbi:MAG: hypothetical protein V1876_00370 [Candidatus Peregrinibacteria bacterium]
MPAARPLACAAVLIAILVLHTRRARGTATHRSHMRALIRREDDAILFAFLRVLVAEGSAV